MSIQVEIKSPGLAKIVRNLEAAPDGVKRSINGAIQKSAIQLQRLARMETPVDTGRLRSSIGVRLMPLRGIVSPNTKYATYVHEGTGRYARGGGGRKTPWAYKGSDGQVHFTNGQKPNPYMERAVIAGKADVDRFFNDAVTEIKQGIIK